MKIGIIREGKIPPDGRVPLVPAQCLLIAEKHPVSITVQPSTQRCYHDEEYLMAGITLSEDLSGSQVLLGVKEVPIDQLIPNKSYFFFSHTIKEQAYNRDLLLAVLDKNIRLIDYEVLTNEKGQRLIAFGKFAGMVGAHNALVTYGLRTGAFSLKRMKDCHDYAEAQAIYKKLQLPPVKIVLTGTGRVGMGSAKVLLDMGIRQVAPLDYLNKSYPYPVFTQLDCENYAAREDGGPFDRDDFYANPQDYISVFHPYLEVSQIMINGIYWDNQAPAFFTKEEMRADYFNIEVIADVTCDIAPVASIPSTLRASTIADPFYGYDPYAEKEIAPFQARGVDIMAIDNLPNEMPRDASAAFGDQFMEHILPELLKEESDILERATIAQEGRLGPHFQYLSHYVSGTNLKV